MPLSLGQGKKQIVTGLDRMIFHISIPTTLEIGKRKGREGYGRREGGMERGGGKREGEDG